MGGSAKAAAEKEGVPVSAVQDLKEAPAVRFSSKLSVITNSWLALPDIEARTQFLRLAIARKRLDIVLHLAEYPLLVGDFISGQGKEAFGLILKQDSVAALDAVKTLSLSAYESMMGDGDPKAIHELGARSIGSTAKEVWSRLLDDGLDVFANSEYNTTLCHMAASHGWVDGLEEIERRWPGKVATITDGASRTPLHTASKYGQVAVVNWLIARGADIQARAQSGRSPLYVCMFGYHQDGVDRPDNWGEVAEVLMKAGASLHDRIGLTQRSATILERITQISPPIADHLLRIRRSIVDAEALEKSTPRPQGRSGPRRV